VKGHTKSVFSVAYSPDGSLLASGSYDETVRQWDVKSGKEIQTLTGHTSSVLSVAYRSDGRHLVSGSWDCAIFIWQKEVINLQVERWVIQYRLSRECVLFAKEAVLDNAVISRRNVKLLQQRGAQSEPSKSESDLQFPERSTQLFCSFFNKHTFSEQGKRIAFYLKPRDSQAMTCVSRSIYIFFQTVSRRKKT